MRYRRHAGWRAHGILSGPPGASRGVPAAGGRGPARGAGGAPAAGRSDGPPPPSRPAPAGGTGPAPPRGLPGTVAWPGGVAERRLRCAPRDRWTGWRPGWRSGRPGTVADNTRFPVLAGTACPITSPGAGKASPEGPPAPDRGHWAAENLNHRQRDRAFGGDACLTRTGNGPANRASPSSIAPAVILPGRRGAGSPAETRRRMRPGRGQAIRALTRPRARRVPAPPDSRRTSHNESPGAGKRRPRRPTAAGRPRKPSGTPPYGHFRRPEQAEQKSVGKSWTSVVAQFEHCRTRPGEGGPPDRPCSGFSGRVQRPRDGCRLRPRQLVVQPTSRLQPASGMMYS